jgi:citrate synthase
MANGSEGVASGLEGIAVAETRLSWVDGAAGRLLIAGHDVEQLAGARRFEEVAAALWAADSEPPSGSPAEGRRPPNWPSVDAVRKALADARSRAFSRLSAHSSVLEMADAMDALRAAIAREAERPRAPGEPAWLAAAEVTGAIAVYAAAWARRRTGASTVAPDPAAWHAEDFLRSLHGAPVAAHFARALDAYLVTVVDHGLNASTFAARVVASTGSDLVSAVTAALGALKGPLHGGAPGPVLDMLDAVGAPERARDWLATELAARRRIMGMGHRVYRVRDPRAAVLEATLEQLRAALPGSGSASEAIRQRLELARAVERAATALLTARHPDRALPANVEFYTAVLLEAIGIPRELFSATFAVARTVGWTAHVEEQRRTGRLIRPSSIYVGRRPEQVEARAL